MERRTNKEVLSKEKIAFLIFGGDLLESIKSPFRSDKQAMQVYEKHEPELIEIYQARYGKGFPNRHYSLRGQVLPRADICPLTSRALMPAILRVRLKIGERTIVARPVKNPDLCGRIAKT